MSPSIMTEPEATEQFKQGYKEGYEAGKACLRKELKQLIKQMSDKEPYVTHTSSGLYHNL